MLRLAFGAVVGLVIGIAAGAALGIHADEGISSPILEAAAEAGVSPRDVAGALGTLHAAGIDADARAYLESTGQLTRPDPVLGGVGQPDGSDRDGVSRALVGSGYAARVRLTHYVLTGVTYSGGHPYPGSTACSWNWPIGTRFRLPDGEVFLCNDRGLLGGAPGWLDLWQRADLVRAYGPYVTVEVLP